MKGLDLRLAIPASLAWIVTAVVIGAPHGAIAVAVALWAGAGVLSALWIARVLPARRGGWLPTVAVSLAAGALCITAVCSGLGSRTPASLVEAAESSKHVSVVATLTQTVTSATSQFDATVVSMDGQALSTPVVIFGIETTERLALGSVIALSGTVVATEAGDHASFLLFARGTPEVRGPPPAWLGWADGLRDRFLGVTASLPGDGGALLAGLAIGDTSSVSDELDDAMKESALSHLTAVSGANCAIVVGLIMVAGAALRLPRWARVTVSLCALVGFVILVTPEPSVMRAAVMAAIVLAALSSGRPVRGLPVLAVATLGLLVLDPWLAREFGFVLSVLATAGLLVLAGPLAELLSRVLPPTLAMGIAIPAAAQVACQPVLILLDASIPTYGIVANLMAAPAAPVATILGLASCLLSALLPPVGAALAWLAWLPSTWIAGVAGFFATLPLSRLPWPEGGIGAAMLALLSALGIVVLFASRRLRRWAALSMCVALVAYGGVVGGGYVLGRLTRPDWQIAGCDVGQGDAFVVRSTGRIAVVDSGVDPELMSNCLSDLGIQHIDLLVLSHFDLDHVGGAGAVAGRVDTVLVGPTSSGADEVLVAQLASAGAEIHSVTEGSTGMLGELRWHVLWPPERLGGLEPGNDASVVVAFEPAGECASGCLSSVFLGDLGAVAQSRLLASGEIRPVDVIKVSHHGSADQDSRLYQAASAAVGLIGVGENDYGHPTQALLDMLTDSGTSPNRTDLDGLVLVASGSTAGSVVVWTQR